MKELDFYFPFLVFAYGLMVIIVTELPHFIEVGRKRIPQEWARLNTHKPLAWISFFVGGLWSLQNIWLT